MLKTLKKSKNNPNKPLSLSHNNVRKKWRTYSVKNKNISLWAEDINYDDLGNEASAYNLSLELLEDACEVLSRNAGRITKQQKNKRKKECWQ